MATASDYAPFGQLRVYTPGFRPVGTIWPVRAPNLAWQLVGAGGATFVIPKGSLRWSEQYVRFWNRVEFHKEGLPVWCGVVVDHAEADAEVSVTCLGGEALYSKRLTDIDYLGTGEDTAGSIAHLLHGMAIRNGEIGIIPGAMEMGGPTYFVKYALDQVSDMLDDLAAKSGGRWWVEKLAHDFSPWLLRWSNTRGVDLSGSVLVSAEVVDRPDYHRNGAEILSTLYAIGAPVGSASGDQNPYVNRMVIPVSDPTARSVYGYMEEKVEYGDVDPASGEDLLMQVAYQDLVRRVDGQRNIGLNVDNRRSMWGKFWLGDTVRAFLPKIGYTGLDTKVTVTAIQADVDSGKMGLTVEFA